MNELAAREREIVRRIAPGTSGGSPGKDLDISRTTLGPHARGLYSKLGPMDPDTTRRRVAVVRAFLWWYEGMHRPSAGRRECVVNKEGAGTLQITPARSLDLADHSRRHDRTVGDVAVAAPRRGLRGAAVDVRAVGARR